MKRIRIAVLIILCIISLNIYCQFQYCIRVSTPNQSHRIIADKYRKNDIPYQYRSTAKFVSFDTHDNITIFGVFVPAKKVDPKKSVIFAHGLGASLSQCFSRADIYYKNGYSLLLIDQRGHGNSKYDRITFGWTERFDIAASYEFLLKKGFSDIMFHGISLGAASGLFAAQICDFSAYVLESPFDTLLHTMQHRIKHKYWFNYPEWIYFPTFWFSRLMIGTDIQNIAPVDHAQYITCPVLLIAGEKEIEITKQETELIFQKFSSQQKTLWFVKNAGHCDYIVHSPKKYKKQLNEFLETL